jgi:hypothetical protein
MIASGRKEPYRTSSGSRVRMSYFGEKKKQTFNPSAGPSEAISDGLWIV